MRAGLGPGGGASTGFLHSGVVGRSFPRVQPTKTQAFPEFHHLGVEYFQNSFTGVWPSWDTPPPWWVGHFRGGISRGPTHPNKVASGLRPPQGRASLWLHPSGGGLPRGPTHTGRISSRPLPLRGGLPHGPTHTGRVSSRLYPQGRCLQDFNARLTPAFLRLP